MDLHQEVYIPKPSPHDPDENGHFGKFGGRFVPETLMPALEQLRKQLTPEAGQAIFLRQQGEIIIEALDETFAEMLLNAKEGNTGQHLKKGIEPQLAAELLDFAVGQGLLLPG